MCAEDRGDGKVQMTPCKKGIKPQVRTVDLQNLARVNRIWPTAVAGEADKELTVTASACHTGGKKFC